METEFHPEESSPKEKGGALVDKTLEEIAIERNLFLLAGVNLSMIQKDPENFVNVAGYASNQQLLLAQNIEYVCSYVSQRVLALEEVANQGEVEDKFLENDTFVNLFCYKIANNSLVDMLTDSTGMNLPKFKLFREVTGLEPTRENIEKYVDYASKEALKSLELVYEQTENEEDLLKRNPVEYLNYREKVGLIPKPSVVAEIVEYLRYLDNDGEYSDVCVINNIIIPRREIQQKMMWVEKNCESPEILMQDESLKYWVEVFSTEILRYPEAERPRHLRRNLLSVLRGILKSKEDTFSSIVKGKLLNIHYIKHWSDMYALPLNDKYSEENFKDIDTAKAYYEQEYRKQVKELYISEEVSTFDEKKIERLKENLTFAQLAMLGFEDIEKNYSESGEFTIGSLNVDIDGLIPAKSWSRYRGFVLAKIGKLEKAIYQSELGRTVDDVPLQKTYKEYVLEVMAYNYLVGVLSWGLEKGTLDKDSSELSFLRDETSSECIEDDLKKYIDCSCQRIIKSSKNLYGIRREGVISKAEMCNDRLQSRMFSYFYYGLVPTPEMVEEHLRYLYDAVVKPDTVFDCYARLQKYEELERRLKKIHESPDELVDESVEMMRKHLTLEDFDSDIQLLFEMNSQYYIGKTLDAVKKELAFWRESLQTKFIGKFLCIEKINGLFKKFNIPSELLELDKEFLERIGWNDWKLRKGDRAVGKLAKYYKNLWNKREKEENKNGNI